jgi:hypothetical protein
MIAERLLDPNTIHITQNENDIILTIEGQPQHIDQIVRCFPFSTPNQWISFRKLDGSEMGLLKTIDELNDESRRVVETSLKDRYHIPTILRIEQIENLSHGTQWQVETDEGLQIISVRGERSIDTSQFPKIVLTDATTRQRFIIPNYTTLDRPSQQLARAHSAIGSRGRGGRGHRMH